MLSRLFPLRVKVSFEDRRYKLGGTIDLTVELRPRRDIEVREGRVDLVCEESYQENFTVTKPRYRAASSPRGGGVMPIGSAMESKEVTEKRRESFVHSSVVFLENERLPSGKTGTYITRMEIEPEPPPHAGEGKVRWRLETNIDLPGARNARVRRTIKVM